MPLYEFKCQDCGKKIEKFCKLGEDGSSFQCPSCSGKVKKMLSTFKRPSTPGGSGGCGPCTSTNCGSCG